jgi:HEAT repeat protein
MKKLLALYLFLALLLGGWRATRVGDRAATSSELRMAGKPLHEWAADLQDPDERVRMRALGVFRAIGGKARPALPAIRAALKDPSPNVRTEACRALGAMGRENVPLLLDALASDDLHNNAGTVLGQMGPSVVPQLLEALGHHDPRVRRGVVAALSRQWPPGSQVNGALRRALEDPDGLVRLQAATALPNLDRDSPPPVDVVRAALHDPDPAVRLRAAEILPNFGASVESAVSMLEPALQDPDGRVRVQAALSLWERDREQRKKALPVLTAALTEGDKSTGEDAAMALTNLMHPDRECVRGVLPALRAIIQRPARHRPRTVLIALSFMRPLGVDASETRSVVLDLVQADDPELVAGGINFLQGTAPWGAAVTSAVGKALGHRDARVRAAAAGALAQLGGGARPVVPALAAAVEDPSQEVRAAAARALGHLGRDAGPAVLALGAALKDPSPIVRAAAAESCRELGPLARDVAGPLAQLLNDPDPGVRAYTAQALPRVNPGQGKLAIPALIRTQTEADYFGRQSSGGLRDLGDAGLAGTIEALDAADPDLRRAAANALASLGQGRPGRVAPALERALKDPDLDVRVTAAGALTRLGYRDAYLVPALLEGLGSRDLSVRNGAIGALSALGPAAQPAVPALVPILADPDEGPIRATVAQVVGAAGEGAPGVEPALVSALGSDDRDVREAAAETCRELGPLARDLADPLAHLLEDRDPLVRTCAARALVCVDRGNGQAALPVLLRSLGSGDASAEDGLRTQRSDALAGMLQAIEAEDPALRRGAALGLGWVGAGTRAVVVPPLRRALKDTDPAVRAAAANSLIMRGVGDSEVVPVLLDRLGSRDLDARNAALGSLYFLGPPAKPAVPVLLRILADPDEGAVSGHVAMTLARIGPGVAGVEPALVAALASDDPSLRLFAARALTLLDTRDPRAFPPLVRLFADPDFRWEGEEALRHFGARMVPAVLEMARDEDPDNRRAALNALLRAGPESWAQALPAVTGALADPEPEVRLAAASLLVYRDPHGNQALPTVGDLVREKSPRLRAQAVGLLRHLRLERDAPAEVWPLVRQAAHDPDARVRATALEALSSLPWPGGSPDFRRVLRAALKDRDHSVRAAALSALSRYPPEVRKAIPDLIAAAKGKDVRLRPAALAALAAVGNEDDEAAATLVAALGEANDARVRVTAALCVRQLGPVRARAALPALEAALHDEDPALREAAVRALTQVDTANKHLLPAIVDLLEQQDRGRPGHEHAQEQAAEFVRAIGQPAIDGLLALLQKDPGRRAAAAVALGCLGRSAARAAPGLKEAVQDRQPRVRLYAAEALWRVSGDAAASLPVLTEVLKGPDDGLRRTAAEVLGAMGPAAREAVPALATALQDPDDDVRRLALVALGRLGPGASAAVPAILHLAQEGNDHRLRPLALQTLGTFGPAARDAVPTLVAATQDPEPMVRLQAGNALWAIDPAAASRAGVPSPGAGEPGRRPGASRPRRGGSGIQ